MRTGFRWGELTELRRQDLDVATRTFAVSRAMVQDSPTFHPTGGRFLVKVYPMDREYRRVKVSPQLVEKVQAHFRDRGLGQDDLLFSMSSKTEVVPVQPAVPDPETLGLTEPNAAGRRYRHGTMSGYGPGGCRCRPCKDAVAI